MISKLSIIILSSIVTAKPRFKLTFQSTCSVACMNGGACNLESQDMCRCETGFTGKFCEVTELDRNWFTLNEIKNTRFHIGRNKSSEDLHSQGFYKYEEAVDYCKQYDAELFTPQSEVELGAMMRFINFIDKTHRKKYHFGKVENYGDDFPIIFEESLCETELIGGNKKSIKQNGDCLVSGTHYPYSSGTVIKDGESYVRVLDRCWVRFDCKGPGQAAWTHGAVPTALNYGFPICTKPFAVTLSIKNEIPQFVPDADTLLRKVNRKNIISNKM